MPQRRGGLEASCAALKGGTEDRGAGSQEAAVKREGGESAPVAHAGSNYRRLLLISCKNQINIRYLLESLVIKCKINYI